MMCSTSDWFLKQRLSINEDRCLESAEALFPLVNIIRWSETSEQAETTILTYESKFKHFDYCNNTFPIAS